MGHPVWGGLHGEKENRNGKKRTRVTEYGDHRKRPPEGEKPKNGKKGKDERTKALLIRELIVWQKGKEIQDRAITQTQEENQKMILVKKQNYVI